MQLLNAVVPNQYVFFTQMTVHKMVIWLKTDSIGTTLVKLCETNTIQNQHVTSGFGGSPHKGQVPKNRKTNLAKTTAFLPEVLSSGKLTTVLLLESNHSGNTFFTSPRPVRDCFNDFDGVNFPSCQPFRPQTFRRSIFHCVWKHFACVIFEPLVAKCWRWPPGSSAWVSSLIHQKQPTASQTDHQCFQVNDTHRTQLFFCLPMVFRNRSFSNECPKGNTGTLTKYKRQERSLLVNWGRILHCDKNRSQEDRCLLLVLHPQQILYAAPLGGSRWDEDPMSLVKRAQFQFSDIHQCRNTTISF